MPTQTPEKRKLFASTLRKLFLGVLVGILAFVVLTGADPGKTAAATADTLNFQAKLMSSSGAIAADGNYNVEFKLYSASSGGSALWTEDYLNSATQGVRVVNGYLTVNLGSITPFPGTINWDQNLYIGMTVRGTGSCSFGACSPTDAEMTPRLKLTATPFALSAGNLAGVSAGGFRSTLTFQGATGGDQTFQIPDLTAAGSDIVCLKTLANCTGTGGGIAGSGSQYYLSKFDTLGGNHIANSSLYDNGSFLGLGTTSNNGLFSIVGSNASQSSIFVQSAASASVPTIVVKEAASQTGDLFQLQDNSGNINGSFNNTGNQLTLGRVAGSGTVTQGKIVFADGTTDNRSITLQVATQTSASATLTIPDLAGVNSTVALTSDSTNFIRNQTGVQASSNFNISATGIAGTSFLTPLLDTPSGTTVLNIGTTNASGGINLNQSTTLAAGKNFVFGSGAGNFDQSASNGTFKTGTGAVSLNGDTTLAASKGLTFASGNGNFDQSASTGFFKTGTGAVTLNGAATANAGLTVTNGGNVAFQKATDYSTTGSSNNVNFGTGALVRLTGASAQTITGIAGGTDGRLLTIINASANPATLKNNDTIDSSAANIIITGTGIDANLPVGAGITLVYDAGASVWRVTGSFAGSGGVTSVGAVSATPTANGATITGNTLNLAVADGTNAGVLSTIAQTIGGAKTFSALLTGNAGLSVSGGAVTLQGNAASSISTTTGNLNLDAAAILQLGATNATSVSIGHAGITTTIQGSTAVTLSGTTGTTLVCQNGSSVLSTCTNSYETTTGTDFIQNQSASTQTANFKISGTGTAATINATTNVQTAGVTRIDASGNLSNIGDILTTNSYTTNLTRTLPTTIGTEVDLGSYALTFGGGTIEATVTVPSNTFSVAKAYNFGVQYNQTGGNWSIVQPISDSGSFAGNDFTLEIRVNNQQVDLRLRRTGTAGFAGIAYIVLKHDGVASDTFTPSTATAAVSAPTIYLNDSILTQIGGAVGIQGNLVLANSGTVIVGGQTVINGTGILQSVALSGIYSNALTLSNVGNVYTGTSATLSGTVQASTFDTPSGTTTLNIGATNATAGINLNQTTTLLGGKNLVFGSGAGTFDQHNSTGTFQTGTGAVSLNGDTALAANKGLTFTAGTGNFDQSASTGFFKTGTGAVTLNGATTANAGLTVTNGGNVAFQKTTDFSTVGSANDVSFGTGALVRLTGASAQTITGIAGGVDGRILTIINAGTNTATLSNNNAGSTAANRITTGTGADVSLPAGATITLVYDSGASLWRISGGVAAVGGVGVNTVGAVSATPTANGATITGTTLNLAVADGTNAGVLSTVAQTIGGAKTFSALLTGNAGLSVSGGAVTLQGNAASSLTTTAGNLTLDAAAILQLGTTNATSVTIGHAGITTTIQGSAAITLSGTTGTTLVCQNASSVLASCDSTFKNPTASNFILNTTSPQSSANINITAATGTVAATLRGASNQNILNLLDSTGAGVAGFDKNGILFAPAAGFTFAGNTNNQTTVGANIQNTSTGAGTVTSNAVTITVSGLANTTGTNVNNGIIFSNATAQTGNSFYGLNFGTGYNDILRYNGTQIISGTGILQSAGLSGTYSNALTLNNVGNVYTGASVSITGTSGIAATVQGTAGQDIVNFNNSGGSVVTKINSSGSLLTNGGFAAGTTAGAVANSTGGFAVIGSKVTAATNSGLVVKAIASQTANLIEIQDSSANLQSSFGSTGNQLTLGNNTASGTSTGTIRLTDGTNDGFYASINTNTLTSSRTISLPDATGTVALTNDTANFIRNQSTQQASSNFNISATGTAGVSFLTPLLDTPSGTTVLNIGTTNASGGIALNQSTTLLGGKNLVFGSGAGNFDQSASSGTFKTGTGAVSLNGDTTLAANKGLTFTAGSGNFDQSASTGFFKTGTGAVTLNGATTANAGLTVTNGGNVAFQKATDYSTIGSSNDVNFGTGALVRLTGASSQTITGIAGGVDGRILTIVNASSSSATLANANAASLAANRITSGTGSDVSLPAGASITLVYDSGASLWRVTGSTAATGGAGVNTVGSVSATPTANGATITGTTLNLAVADGTNAGLLSTTAQTIGGAKTFSALLTGNAGLSVSGGAITLQGNAASSITTTVGNLSLDAAAILQLGASNATSVAIGHAGITTTIQGSTAVTLSGTTGTTLVCTNGSSVLSTCTNSYETTTGTDFIQNQTGSTQTAGFKINGTGTAASYQIATTGSFDTAAAGTLNIGTTNATSIVLQQNVSIAAGKSITFGATGNFDQSASSGSFKTGTGNVSINGTTTVAANQDFSFAAGTSAFNDSLSTGSFKTSTGNNFLNGNTTLATNKDFTYAAGTGAFDQSASTGPFKTSTGGVFINGTVTVAATKSINFAASSTGDIDQSNSSGQFRTGTGTVFLNGNTTIAAGKNITLASGGGTITQNFVGIAGGDGFTSVVNNSVASGSSTVNAHTITLSGTNTTGSNRTIGVNFTNVTNPGGTNNFTGLNFGTGFTDILRYNSTQLISGTGLIQNAALDNTLTYSNITGVGALVNGSIASGFGTIATSNTITGTVLNGTTSINTGAGAGTARIDSSGNLTNIGAITAAGTAQINVSGTAATSIGNTTGAFTIQGSSASVIKATSGANTTTIDFTTPSANVTLHVPALAAGSYNICTDSGNCAGVGATLQTSYNFSIGGATPEIKLDTTRGALTIQDADTTIGATANLFEILNAGGGTNLFKIQGNGNVGIGTSGNPSAALSIGGTTGNFTVNTSGNIATSGTLTVNNSSAFNGIVTVSGQADVVQVKVKANATQTADLQQFTASNGTSIFSGIDATGRYYSKDQTSGFKTFIDAPNGTLSSDHVIYLPNAGGTICTTSGNCIGNGGSGDVFNGGQAGPLVVGTTDNTDTTLVSNNTARIVIKGNGNVGIGTTGVPSQLLSVGGTTGNFTVNTSGNVATSGTYNGNSFTSSGLTFSAAGAASIQAATGQNLNIDSGNTGTLNLGTSSTTSAVAIGRNGITTTNNGALTVTQLLTGSAGVTVGGGAIALTGNAASSLTTTAGALSLQGAGGVSLTTTNTTVSSGITIQTGNSSAGTAGTVSIDTGTSSSGTSVLNLGTANAGSIVIGNGTSTISINSSVNIANGKNITFGTTGNFDQSASSGTFKTGTGAVSLNGAATAAAGLTVTNAGSLATKAAADFTTTGTTTDANLGTASLVRLNGATAQTINGITGGSDGRILTIVNAGANAAVIKNASGGAGNQVITGTGGDISLTSGASITLVYDLTSAVWRTTGSVSSTGGYIQLQGSTPGTSQTGNFNISGTGIAGTLQGSSHVYTPDLDVASAGTLSIGVNTATAISISKSGVTTTVNGALTAVQLLTGQAGITTSGGAVSLTGNAASSLTTTAGLLTLQGAGGVSITSTNTTVSSAITIKSGNSSAGTAGTVTIDTGTSSSGSSAINIGTTNASSINIGSGIAGTNTQAITIGNSGAGTVVSIGAVGATGNILLDTSGTQISLLGNTTHIDSLVNDVNAFQITRSNTAAIFTADTTNSIITVAGGFTSSGGAVSLNDSSNFNTSINTGTSTGTVAIGNSATTGFTLETGTATANIFNGNTNHTIQLATGAATQSVTIGSTNSSSTTKVQGGAFSLNVTNSGVGINAGASPSNPFSINTLATTTGNTGYQAAISTGTNTNNGLLVQGVASQGSTTKYLSIQDSAGANIAQVGADDIINLGSATHTPSILFSSTDLSHGGLQKTMTAGTGGVSANDVVVFANDGGNARVIDTTTVNDARVFGVAMSTATAGNPTNIATYGFAIVKYTGTAPAIGDILVTSATGGSVQVDNFATKGILGYATTVGNGTTVGVVINPVGGAGGSDGNSLVQVPASNSAGASGANVISPNSATTAVVGLTVNGNVGAGGAATAEIINQSKNAVGLQINGSGTDTSSSLLGLSTTTATSGSLLNISQTTSSFTGTGALINIGNPGVGAKLIDLQNNSTSKFNVDASGVVSLAGGQTADITTIGATSLKLDTGGSAAITLGGTNASQINIGHGTIATAITGNVGITNTNATTTLSVSTNTTPTTAALVVNDTSGTATDKLLALQNNGTAKFTVDANGNVVALGTLTTGSSGQFQVAANGDVTNSGKYNTNTLTSSALSFGSGTASTISINQAAGSTAGGNLTIQGGQSGAGVAATNGGDLLLTGGAIGASSTGVQGLVKLSTSVFTSSAGNQSFGVNSAVTQASVDSNSTIEVSSTVTGPITVTIPAPTQKITGRLLYVTISGAYQVTIAPSGGTSFTMNPATGATLVWNTTINAGVGGWLNAGADGGSNSYIQNQSAADQAASFRIGGTGQINNNTVTSGNLLSITQNTSAFTGTGILLNVANGSGTSTGKLIDLQNNSTSKFSVDANGNTVALGTLGIGTASIGAGSSITVSGNSGFTQVGVPVAGFGAIGFQATLTASNYALAASSSSGTIVNTLTGQPLLFRVNNATVGQFSSSGDFYVGSGTTTFKVAQTGGAITLQGGQTADITTFGATTLKADTGGAAAITIGGTNASQINIGHGTIATAITGNVGITNTNATTSLNVSTNTTPTTAVVVINDTTGTAGDKLLALQNNGATKFTVDINGNVVVGTGTTSTAGTGSLTNNGATINTTLTVANDSDGGALGGTPGSPLTAAQSVDAYTAISVNQTTAGQSITIPSPTASTTYGRLLYISNVGTTTFTFTNTYLTASLKQGATATLIWENVNGTPNWTYAGSDAGGIFNQTSQQTGANFNIDGSGTAASFKVTAGTGLFDVATGGALNIGTSTATSIIMGSSTSTANTIQSSGGTRIQSTTDNTSAFSVQNSSGASTISVDTTNTSGGLNVAVNGGAETAGPTGWTAIGSSTVTQDVTVGEFASGTAGVKAAVTAANGGAKNTFGSAVITGNNYNVSFSVKSSSGTPTLSVLYFNGTSSVACAAGSYASGSITTAFVKYTCTFAATATNAGAYIAITQTDGTNRSLFIDNLSVVQQNTSGTQNTGVIKIGGGGNGQGLTLFQLDTAAGNPFTGSNPALAGAMYFDTTAGKMQCYDGSIWGACGAAPNSNVTLTPEYAGAVLHGTGIGTLTSDFCGNGGGLSVNTGFCASGEARNYYNWTSVQPSTQGYSMYVTYKLPSTFKAFVNGTTTVTARTDNTSNASASYKILKSTGSSITSCSASIDIVGGTSGATVSTWTPRAPTTDPSTCSFAANNYIIIEIDVNASNSANVQVENLNFSFSNQ